MKENQHRSARRWLGVTSAGALVGTLGLGVAGARCVGAGPGGHVDEHHHRRHGPAYGAGRPRLRRNRPGYGRCVCLGQRSWRRVRPEDQVRLPRRPVQPGRNGHADPKTGTAGQHLRRRRLARDAHPGRGTGVPEFAEGPAAVYRVGMQLLEQPEIPGKLRVATPLYRRRQDPGGLYCFAFRGRESRLPVLRTTSSGRTLSPGSTWNWLRPRWCPSRPMTQPRCPALCPTRWRR